ncbi:hypothetical protein Tco_1520123, partial [Tanacetum coccineum]
ASPTIATRRLNHRQQRDSSLANLVVKNNIKPKKGTHIESYNRSHHQTGTNQNQEGTNKPDSEGDKEPHTKSIRISKKAQNFRRLARSPICETLVFAKQSRESKQEDQNTLARNKKVNQPSFDQCTNHQDKKKKQERSQKGDAFSPERQRDDISKKERKKERGIVIKDKKGHIGS